VPVITRPAGSHARRKYAEHTTARTAAGHRERDVEPDSPRAARDPIARTGRRRADDRGIATGSDRHGTGTACESGGSTVANASGRSDDAHDRRRAIAVPGGRFDLARPVGG